MAILYAVGIWDEAETVYVSKHGGLSPHLSDALLFGDTKQHIHPIMNWLPVFVVDDLMDEDDNQVTELGNN